MSMNLYASAEREIFVPALNKKDIQTQSVELWQTPTKVTYAALESGDPYAYYRNWVKGLDTKSKMPVHADDDIFCEKDPIGWDEIDEGQDHLDSLANELVGLENEGYKIHWGIV